MDQHSEYGRPRWWQWLTVLSLDAPLVALVWQWLFSRIVNIRLPWHDPALLGLGVWCVYAADRWIEGWRLTPTIVQTPRHHFYMRYRWPVFGVAWVVFIATAMIAVTFVRGDEFRAGCILLIPTLVYLFSHQLLHRNHPLRAPKEICIAVIFALGCALAPAVHASQRLAALCMPVILFGLLCFANCALISVWEMEVDARHGQTSLALQLKGAAALIGLLPWLIAFAGAAVFFFAPASSQPAAICTALSGMLMGVIDVLAPRIGRLPARAMVDVALMTPVLFMAWYGWT